MTMFRVTIERKIVRTVIVDAMTNKLARATVEDYGVTEAFHDFEELPSEGSDTLRITRVAIKAASVWEGAKKP